MKVKLYSAKTLLVNSILKKEHIRFVYNRSSRVTTKALLFGFNETILKKNNKRECWNKFYFPMIRSFNKCFPDTRSLYVFTNR